MPPRARAVRALADALGRRRVLVVAGAGGVGKTTVAAALGLRAAQAGRRTLVCTIDPSPRLATSLGLARLAGEPHRLALPAVGGAGELWAMRLDTKRTFDTLVERYAPTAAARRRILENRFYQQVSSALAGSHEYMAMEKLLDLTSDPRFDLVVLDTPPTRHALDFLEAPDRLLRFLDTGVLRWFVKPYFIAGRLTLKVASRTGAAALRLADRVLGLQFLQDLSEFFLAFEGMYDGFRQRAARVRELLRDPRSGFIAVASPEPPALEEAAYLHARLRETGFPFVAFVVNRIHAAPVPPAARSPVDVEPRLAARLLEVAREQKTLAAAELRRLDRLAAAGEPVVTVPDRDTDVHDVAALLAVAESMVPWTVSPSPRPAGSVAMRRRGRAR